MPFTSKFHTMPFGSWWRMSRTTVEPTATPLHDMTIGLLGVACLVGIVDAVHSYSLLRTVMKHLAAAFVLAVIATPAMAQKNYQPVAPNGSLTLAAGGTAQLFQSAGSFIGCVVVNPTTATEQGIGAAEVIWVNVVGTAVQIAGGTSIPVEAGSSLSIGPTSKAISWIAATTGHLIAGYCQ